MSQAKPLAFNILEFRLLSDILHLLSVQKTPKVEIDALGVNVTALGNARL